MKRLISLLLSCFFIFGTFSLMACGQTPAESSTDASQISTTVNTGNETTTATGSASAQQTTAASGAQTTNTAATAGTASDKASETAATGAGATETVLDGLSKHPEYADVNFGGKTFTFATTGIDCFGEFCLTYEITAELTGNDSLVNEAIVKRNTIVETLYNCKIAEEQSAGAAGIISNDLALGVCNHEFCMPLWQNTWWNNDLYYEMTSIGIDASHSWWNQDYIDAFGEYIDGTLRFQTISGKFNLITYDMTYGVLVNMNMYEQLFKNGDITIDIFEEARNGTWTVDKLIEAAIPASKDVNGNSVISVADGDTVGLALDNGNWNPAHAFFFAFGGISTTRNSEGSHVSVDAGNYDLNKLSDAIDGTIKIHYADGSHMTSETNVHNSICNGQSLFAPYYFRCLELTYNSLDIRLSVVPYPKLNESQERYYNYVVNRYYGVKVAKTCTNPRQAAQFLEVFGFHSEKILYPAYVKYMATQCFCNEEAAEMLDIIFNSLVFDPASIYSAGLETSVVTMVQKKQNNVTRAIAKVASMYNPGLTNVYTLAKASVTD